METTTLQTNEGPKNCRVIKAKLIRINKDGEAHVTTVTGQNVSFDGLTPDQVKGMIQQIVSSGGMVQVENSPINVKLGYTTLLQQLNQLMQLQQHQQQKQQKGTKPNSPKRKSETSEKKQARDDDEKKQQPALHNNISISIEEYKIVELTEANRQAFLNEFTLIIHKFMKNKKFKCVDDDEDSPGHSSDSFDSHGKKSLVSDVLSDEVTAAISELDLDDEVSLGRIGRAYSALRPEQWKSEEDGDSNDTSTDVRESEEISPDELEFVLECIKHHKDSAKLAPLISAGNWEAVEQVVSDNVLEKEEKERKATKKREKKQRKKAKLKEEAAQKAAEAAQKKREKAILSWRSRVISAMESNDVSKLGALLDESPLRKEREIDDESSMPSTIVRHLEFLVPNTVPKSRANAQIGSEARLRLADFVFSLDPSMAFIPLRSGRTALHTACFYDNLQFVTLVFNKAKETATDAHENDFSVPDNFLEMTCQESGLSPLQYASISCSWDVMEFLLEKGCSVCTPSTASLTSTSKGDKGVTCIELVESLLSGDFSKSLHTKGVALQEIAKTCMSSQGERKPFIEIWEDVRTRLMDVKENGYTAPSRSTPDAVSHGATTPIRDVNPSEVVPSKNMKKKRKKKNKGGKRTETADSSLVVVDAERPNADVPAGGTRDDALVQALLAMGFERTQIDEAVVACGGTDRATADDVVMWIFAEENDESSPAEANQDENSDIHLKNVEDDSSSGSESAVTFDEASSDRLDEEASKKLAAKREEKRRRNREWNNREQARQEHHTKAVIAQKALQHQYAVRRTPSPGSGAQVAVSAGRIEAGSLPVASSQADDDRTVSSFSSNRGLSVSSQEFVPANFTAVPPGVSPPHMMQNFGTAQRMLVNPPPGLASNMPHPGLPAPTMHPLPGRHHVSASPRLLPQIPRGFAPDTAPPMVAPVKPRTRSSFHSTTTVPSVQDILDVEVRASALPSDYGSPDIFGSLGTASLLVPGLPPSHNLHAGHGSASASRRQMSFDPAPSITSVSDESAMSLSSLFGSHLSEDLSSVPPLSFVRGEDKATSRLRNPTSDNGMVGTSSLWQGGGDQEIPTMASKLPIFLLSEEGDSEDNQLLLWNNNSNNNDGKQNVSSDGGQSSIW
ncbi:MAG: hypothetical protein SGILL_003459 [Bacillariaceae sp.]